MTFFIENFVERLLMSFYMARNVPRLSFIMNLGFEIVAKCDVFGIAYLKGDLENFMDSRFYECFSI